MLIKLLFIILLSGGVFAEKATQKPQLQKRPRACTTSNTGLIGQSQIHKASQGLAEVLRSLQAKKKDSRELFLYQKSLENSAFLSPSTSSPTPGDDMASLQTVFKELF